MKDTSKKQVEIYSLVYSLDFKNEHVYVHVNVCICACTYVLDRYIKNLMNKHPTDASALFLLRKGLDE